MIVIDQGKAKVYNLSKDGKEVVLGILQKGDIEGQQHLFKQSENESFVEAVEDPGFAQLTAQIFKNFCRKHQICH